MRDAVTCYCEAMCLWQEYKEQDVDCDKLQRIHAMENLEGLLKDNPHLGQDGCIKTDQLTTLVSCVIPWGDFSCPEVFTCPDISLFRPQSFVWSTAHVQTLM